MKENQTYRIGRSQSADVVLSDNSVSRSHAELVATGDGRYYLNDCGSRFGTHILHNGRWKAIRQVFVSATDPIKLGEFETTVDALIEILAAGGGQADSRKMTSRPAPKTQRVGQAPAPDYSGKADLPDGEVERDPETGEIIEKG